MNMDADTQEVCQYANDINNSTSSNSKKTVCFDKTILNLRLLMLYYLVVIYIK